MLKKTVTYTDYNGNQRTEDLYFNLTQTELTKMEVSAEGGLSTLLQQIIDSQDLNGIFEVFQDFVLKAYGEKSEDGRRFIKSQALCDELVQTEAYNVLISELLSDADKLAAFINGIMPANLVQAAANGTLTQSAAQSVLMPAT